MKKSDVKVGYGYIADEAVVIVTHVGPDVARAVPALPMNSVSRDVDARIALAQEILDWDVIVAETTHGRWAMLCIDDAPLWFSDDERDDVDIVPVDGFQITDNSICHFWRTRLMAMQAYERGERW